MKTLDFKTVGLQPLTADEEQNISGGFWLQLISGAAAVMVGAVVSDWDNFKAGLRGERERPK